MIDRLSEYLARNKAMPVFVGVLLVILNFVAQFFGGAPVIGLIGRTNFLLHLGVIVGLVGILIGDAL